MGSPDKKRQKRQNRRSCQKCISGYLEFFFFILLYFILLTWSNVNTLHKIKVSHTVVFYGKTSLATDYYTAYIFFIRAFFNCTDKTFDLL